MKKFNQVFIGLVFLLGALNIGASERKEISSEAQSEIRALFEINEDMHASFFEYDGEKVEKHAKKLHTAIDEISDDSIRQLLRFSQQQLDEISAEHDREKNDEKYHNVSMAFIHLINTFDIGEGYNVYSCPMVQKKWVQNSKKMDKVHNPFHPGMKHCGDKETNF